MWWVDSTISTASWWNEGGEKNNAISDAVREQVAEQAKKGKQIGWQIVQNKQQNNAFAKFLMHLMNTIQSESLLGTMYNLFFTVKHDDSEIRYIKQTTNFPVLIGMFAPFFRDKVVELQMPPLYESIYSPEQILTISTYIHYLKRLSASMHDNTALEKNTLIAFLAEICKEFHLTNNLSIEQNTNEQLHTIIHDELYGLPS